jgi:hypothetical protein
MAEKETKISKSNNNYKATGAYKIFMSNSGLLTEKQHEQLLKGESVDLKGTSDKQMRYLITNNLIKQGE